MQKCPDEARDDEAQGKMTMARSTFALCAAALLPSAALCLQNGLGLAPPMGYSSWNDCASEITEARGRLE
jgi:hypothetical protein